ncbi:MAG TPA: hypothetical protein VIQ31_32785 [Phormidium sp.]
MFIITKQLLFEAKTMRNIHNINQNSDTVEDKARSLMVNKQRAARNRQQTVFSRSAAEIGLNGEISE